MYDDRWDHWSGIPSALRASRPLNPHKVDILLDLSATLPVCLYRTYARPARLPVGRLLQPAWMKKYAKPPKRGHVCRHTVDIIRKLVCRRLAIRAPAGSFSQRAQRRGRIRVREQGVLDLGRVRHLNKRWKCFAEGIM